MASVRRSLTPALAALVLGVALALAYANSHGVPLIFDDHDSIRDNPTIRQLSTAWSPPAERGLTVSGRPFLNFTLSLNYAVSGLEVWSYHVLNLLIHLGAGCCLYGIVRRTLTGLKVRSLLAGEVSSHEQARSHKESRRGTETPPYKTDAAWIALVVALLWVLHPLQTESVTYVVQRAESLTGLLHLLTLWAFIRSLEPGASRAWAWLAWTACLLGMATKEVMVVVPVLVAFYDRIFVADSWREVLVRRGRFHLALASTWLLLAGLVYSTSGRGGTAGFAAGVQPMTYALTQADAVVRYLRLAFWPEPLVFDYGKGLVSGWRDVWWQVPVVLGLLAASIGAAWRGRPAGYLGLVFFAVLAPTSSFVPVVTQTMAEHRVYLSLAALVVLVVVTLYQWWGRSSFVLWAALILVCGGLTLRRNHDYRSEQAIWEDTVAKRPANGRAWAALGAIHQAAGRREEALAALQEQVRVDPEVADAHNNLGNAWMKLGHWAEARDCFETALTLKPTDESLVLNNLGNALLQLGRIPEAIGRFEAALQVKPDRVEPRYNLANTLAQAGLFEAAAVHFAVLLRLRPEDGEARSNYGNVLQALGRDSEALVQFEAAVRLRPGQAELHNNLGTAYAQAGRFAEAEAEFLAALRLQPDFAGAAENLARVRRELPRR